MPKSLDAKKAVLEKIMELAGDHQDKHLKAKKHGHVKVEIHVGGEGSPEEEAAETPAEEAAEHESSDDELLEKKALEHDDDEPEAFKKKRK